jgi:hypothetical protein
MFGTLLAWCGVSKITAEAKKQMKIYFLLILISVFVGLSYMPMRTEAKQKVAAQPDSLPA